LAATLAISQVGRDLDLVPLPDFSPLQTIFQRALQALTADIAQAEAGEGAAGPLTDTASAIPMVVSSRDDVRRTLDKLLEYFQVHEPGHPAPVLLSRVRRMVGADFETLMNELYQDGPKLVQLINAPRQS
jgi:type VI secretion system protein ImpA